MGYNLAYVDDAVSYHMIPRSRMTQKYLNERFSNQANCDSFTTFRRNENSKKVLLKLIMFSHIPNFLNTFSAPFQICLPIKIYGDLTGFIPIIFFHKIISDYKFATNKELRICR